MTVRTSTQMRIPLRGLQPVIVHPEGWNLPEGYASTVLDFEEERSIKISLPKQYGRPVEIDPGTPLVLEIPLPDSLRRYTTRARDDQPNETMLILEWPREAERIQRRSDVRVATTLRAKVELDDFSDGPPIVHCWTSDLSAGGAQLLLKTELPTQTLFQVTIELPDVGPQSCGAVVVRTGKLEKPVKNAEYWAGVAFIDIPEDSRREITKYVFDMQRELLRRA